MSVRGPWGIYSWCRCRVSAASREGGSGNAMCKACWDPPLYTELQTPLKISPWTNFLEAGINTV